MTQQLVQQTMEMDVENPCLFDRSVRGVFSSPIEAYSLQLLATLAAANPHAIGT